MKLVLCSFLCLLLSVPVWAQPFPIQIKVVDSKGIPVEFAAVSLQLDSAKRLGNVTDSNGLAVFSLETEHDYSLKITATGFHSLEQSIHLSTLQSFFSFTLKLSDNALKEVVITKAKPLMRQEDDKTIVDPEQLAEASSNGYEVLEKTPGLFVDQDGNIYLSSTTPATVYINGRELKMSRSDIASLLKNLPPTSIEKIEIMRTPSAKYDASGSGGIVNVVLKKGVKIGFNGSVNTGLTQGVYGNQFAGFNLSNNNGAASSYLNVNVTRQNTYQQLNTDRVLAADTLLSQQAYTTYPGSVFYVATGYNKDVNDKWNLAYDGRFTYNKSSSLTDNTNELFTINTHTLLGSIKADIDNRSKAFLMDHSFAAKYKIDTSGSEWASNLCYTFSSGNMVQNYLNSSILGSTGGNGTTNNDRHLLVAQSDLNKMLKHHINFETGIKASFLMFRNDARYFTETSSGQQSDFTRTNKYHYTESINAAYVQASKTFGGFILKTGLRMENTNMLGKQLLPGDTSFNIFRTDFFPYVYFSKKIMAIAGYDLRAYLVYHRTISRPSYEQLNPFPKYVDQFMSEIGNPTLKPQFTQNYEANVSVGEHPLLAIGYNDTKDMFSNVFYQGDSTSKQAYRGYDNIGTDKEFYLRGLAAIPPGGKYFAVIGGQYNHNVYDGLYEGKPLHFIGESWLFFTYHQLRLGKRSTFTLNGFWRFPGALQFYQLSQMGSLNASLNRKFVKDKLTVTISVTDMFYTNNNNFVVQQGSVNARGYRGGDTRRFGLSLRYNFGIHKKEDTPGMFDINSEEKK